MLELNIKFDEKERQKVIIILCRPNKELIIKNIEYGRINLDKWLFD